MGGTAHIDGRRERSRRTAAKVVGAARQRFLEAGYVETTIESVASLAGVAVQTVYYVFGTKPRLLTAVLDATIAGDDRPIALMERGWEDAINSAPDADTAVRRVAALGVEVLARVAPIIGVVRRAASIPEVAEIYDETRGRRRVDQRRIAELLQGAGHLRRGLRVDAAADAIYALMSEEVFGLLVGDCGWSAKRFESWFADALVSQLVTPVATTERPPAKG